MINREMGKLGGSELLYFICYTIICANFQEWWKNGLFSSYLNVIVQNVFHGLTPYFWDFPGAQILVDLHSNNSAWENRIHDSQMLNEPAYKWRGSGKQLATWRHLDCLALHRRLHTLSGVLLLQGFILSDSSLYCIGASRKKPPNTDSDSVTY